MNICECGCGQECKNRFVNRHNIQGKFNPCPKKEKIQKLCECNCGQLCNNRFVAGHGSRTKINPFYTYKNTNPKWNKGLTKEKDGITCGRKKGSHTTERWKQKIKDGLNAFYSDQEKSAGARAAISCATSHPKSEIAKQKLSLALAGHLVADETRIKIRKTKIEQARITPSEVRAKQSKSHKKRLFENLSELDRLRRQLKNIKDDPEIYKKIFLRRPMSKPEIEMQKMINQMNLPYEYVGNFQFRIGKRYPDFINKRTQKIIEVFGDFYHKGQDPQKLIDYYKNFGYECIVLWASEIHKNYDNVSQRILVFHNTGSK